MATEMKKIRNFLIESAAPLLAAAMLLSISTNLRSAAFPVGPGELMLLALAVMGFLYGHLQRVWKTPMFLFWCPVLLCMAAGALLGPLNGNMNQHHAMAYAFASLVTVGLSLLMIELTDAALRKTITWLCSLTAVFLWFGFIIYLSGDLGLANKLNMTNLGDLRYSGWSVNPNQLALFFVPLPVWLVALWRNVDMPTRFHTALYGVLLFALMLMGLLVRSDGLFLVWLFEFVILIFLRLRWEMKANRSSLLAYAAMMVLCAFLVKTFAHGEMRKSVKCAIETISQGEGLWSSKCYDGQSFKDQKAFRIGYSDPLQKTGVRQEHWMNGLQSWSQSPWIGHGPGEYSWNSIGNEKESHNITIDLLTQGGVLAGVAWIALIFYLLINAWRIRDSYTFSVVLMMAVFTFFHNTRQPYFWFVLAFSHEAIRRRLFVSLLLDKA